MPKPSAAALKVVQAAIDQFEAYGSWPNQSEIAEYLNITQGRVSQLLDKLEPAGYATRLPGHKGVRADRDVKGATYTPPPVAQSLGPNVAMAILPDEPGRPPREQLQALMDSFKARDDEPVDVPVIGYATCGAPCDLAPPAVQFVTVQRGLCHGRCVAFVAVGESMSGDDIHDGSIVVVRLTPAVDWRSGDIYAMHEPSGWTLGRVHPEDERTWIVKSNRAYGPRATDEGTYSAGVVVSVLPPKGTGTSSSTRTRATSPRSSKKRT